MYLNRFLINDIVVTVVVLNFVVVIVIVVLVVIIAVVNENISAIIRIPRLSKIREVQGDRIVGRRLAKIILVEIWYRYIVMSLRLFIVMNFQYQNHNKKWYLFLFKENPTDPDVKTKIKN